MIEGVSVTIRACVYNVDGIVSMRVLGFSARGERGLLNIDWWPGPNQRTT